jgi:hypothetical protein
VNKREQTFRDGSLSFPCHAASPRVESTLPAGEGQGIVVVLVGGDLIEQSPRVVLTDRSRHRAGQPMP